ncbi:hypothetical protein BDP27DRAFT_1366893 [Rhodocollybia butyracea]|uniref:Uncharacterized protein n=1 Tax=Rhodocollybia butyracea TaxID=206335 RepID=A0A9P5PGD5_9AGAR|nr:hypothetical protein BDP27DRAFT_1366893 [Rhodocollybia butyracea]
MSRQKRLRSPSSSPLSPSTCLKNITYKEKERVHTLAFGQSVPAYAEKKIPDTLYAGAGGDYLVKNEVVDDSFYRTNQENMQDTRHYHYEPSDSGFRGPLGQPFVAYDRKLQISLDHVDLKNEVVHNPLYHPTNDKMRHDYHEYSDSGFRGPLEQPFVGYNRDLSPNHVDLENEVVRDLLYHPTKDTMRESRRDYYEYSDSGFRGPMGEASVMYQDRERQESKKHMELKIQHLESDVRALQRQVGTYKDILDRLGHIFFSVGDKGFDAEELLLNLNMHINGVDRKP